MSPDDFTPSRFSRITNSYGSGGLGLVPLVSASPAAYLGCLYRHRDRLAVDADVSVAGFTPAYEGLSAYLGEGGMPPIGEFLGGAARAGGARGESLGHELAEEVGKKKEQEMDARAIDC
jgi:hypothetical protein